MSEEREGENKKTRNRGKMSGGVVGGFCHIVRNGSGPAAVAPGGAVGHVQWGNGACPGMFRDFCACVNHGLIGQWIEFKPLKN